MLAGIFVTGGIAGLRDPKGHEQMARPVLDKLIELAPTERPLAPATLIKIDAGAKLGFGTLLALGKLPRLSALALSATLVPTTAAGHRFWEHDDPDRRTAEQIHFTKNLGLLGGLLLALADTGGKPSLAWRARRAGKKSAAKAQQAGDKVNRAVERANRTAERVNRGAEQAAGRAMDAVRR